MLRRWFGRPAVGLVCLSLALGACGGDEEGQGGASSGSGDIAPPATLVKDGALTVCTDPTYPPLEYFGAGRKPDGYDLMAATAAAEKMGLDVEFKPTSFSGVLPGVDSGRCDVAWSGLFIDEQRTAKFSAVPYHESTSVILVRQGNPEGIASPEDLAGKTVASQNGSNLLKEARRISQENEAAGRGASNVQGYDKFEEAIQQLVVGRADAVITQDMDASYRALKQPGQFEVAYKFPDAEAFGVYYKPANAELGDKLHQALTTLARSGDLARIAEEEGMPADGIKVAKPVGGSQ